MVFRRSRNIPKGSYLLDQKDLEVALGLARTTLWNRLSEDEEPGDDHDLLLHRWLQQD